jgi:hypothetical protein
MNNFHIPILSYVFIGVTSLVLTYATITDTENEIIIEPTEIEQSPNVLDGLGIPSVNETIDKVKSLNPFDEGDSTEKNIASQQEIPTAVPIAEVDRNTKESSTYGGKKKQTREKKPQKSKKLKSKSKTKKQHK